MTVVKIKPNYLYSRADLAAMLKPDKVDVDTFIARLKPRKVLRMVWFGEDILAALRSAPVLDDQAESSKPLEAPAILPPVASRGKRKRRGRGAAIDSMAGFRKLDEELR